MPLLKPKKTPANPTLPPPQHPFDQIHGVDTSGLIPAGKLITGHPNDTHVTAYYGVAPRILRTLIDLWRTTNPPHPLRHYTFIDIGAGKGRAMLVASESPFHRVSGVELNPEMADIAQRNVEIWQSTHAADPTAPPIAPIVLHQQDALAFDLPHTPTLAFLYHPFEAPVFKHLLRRIEAQFARRPGAFDLIYVNAECRDILDQHPAFLRLFLGQVPMSPEDRAADIEAVVQQKEYGSTGDEQCAIYRYVGRGKQPS